MRTGATDGQVKVVNEGGGGMAYSWGAAAGEWEKIGEVRIQPGLKGFRFLGFRFCLGFQG